MVWIPRDEGTDGSPPHMMRNRPAGNSALNRNPAMRQTSQDAAFAPQHKTHLHPPQPQIAPSTERGSSCKGINYRRGNGEPFLVGGGVSPGNTQTHRPL